MKLNLANNFGTGLTEDISDTITSFGVVDLSDAPDTPYRMTIYQGEPADGEIIEVTSHDKANNQITECQRGMEDTTAQSWDKGDEIANLGTAGLFDELPQLGQNDDEYNLFQALNQRVDERAETLTYDADGNLTKVEEYETDAKTNLIKETNLTYNADGDLVEVEEIIGDTTVTETLNYDADGNLESVERSVT